MTKKAPIHGNCAITWLEWFINDEYSVNRIIDVIRNHLKMIHEFPNRVALTFQSYGGIFSVERQIGGTGVILNVQNVYMSSWT